MVAYNHVVSPPCGEPTVAPEAQHAAGCGDESASSDGMAVVPPQTSSRLALVCCVPARVRALCVYKCNLYAQQGGAVSTSCRYLLREGARAIAIIGLKEMSALV